MDKNTKTVLLVGAAAVLGYALWKKNQPAVVKVAADAPKSGGMPPEYQVKDYAMPALGGAAIAPMGAGTAQKVSTPAVSFAASNKNVEQSNWSNAVGSNIAPTFFKVKDSSF